MLYLYKFPVFPSLIIPNDKETRNYETTSIPIFHLLSPIVGYSLTIIYSFDAHNKSLYTQADFLSTGTTSVCTA